MANPFYFTASDTITSLSYNSSDANSRANPLLVTAFKTIS